MEQFPLVEEAQDALGPWCGLMVEFEADDALATAAARFADAVDQVVIVSPDKDLAQCVGGTRVVLYDRIRRATYDEAAVHAKFGVPPAAIPDFLALVGDSADGIPGIPGWGAKSAAAVLATYGHLEHIPDDPRTWSVVVRNRDRLPVPRDAAPKRPIVKLRRRCAAMPLAEGPRICTARRTARSHQAFCARLSLSVSPTAHLWRPD